MDQRLFFLLNMARHKVFHSVDIEAERQLGIPVTQVAALLFVAKTAGCMQKDLGHALSLNKAAVSGLVARMVKADLIRKQQSSLDGRGWELFLAEKGKAILPRVPVLLNALNSKLSEGFDQAELDVIYRFLNTTISRF